MITPTHDRTTGFRLTVYLTVYDSLALWYLHEVMVQKPAYKWAFLGTTRCLNGFRCRVSQVRILPGPPFRSHLTCVADAAFPCGKPPLDPLIDGL